MTTVARRDQLERKERAQLHLQYCTIAVVVAFESLLRLPRSALSSFLLLFVALSALGLILLNRRSPAKVIVASAAVLFGCQFMVIVLQYPSAANHSYLLLLLFALFSLLRLDRIEEYTLLQQLLCLAPLVVFFWSGVQKLVYGYYVDASFLTYALHHSPRFSEFFELFPFLKVKAATHLAQYSSKDPVLILLSNAVWLAEVFLPLLFLVQRLQVLLAVLLMILVLLIQCAARELSFGLLMLSLLSLWIGPRVQRVILGVALLCSILAGTLFLAGVGYPEVF